MSEKFCTTRYSEQPEHLTVEEMHIKSEDYYNRYVKARDKAKRYKRQSPKLDLLISEADYCLHESRFYSNHAQMHSQGRT